MERPSGLRRLLQSMLFPDLHELLTATRELDGRMNGLDKSLLTLESSVGALDKGVVQMDQTLTRQEKQMLRLNKAVDRTSRGVELLNQGIGEREKELTVRVEKLRSKMEVDHVRAIGEVVGLLETLSLETHIAEQQPDLKARTEIVPDRVRALSELSAALGVQASDVELQSGNDADLNHGLPLDGLPALVESAKRGKDSRRGKLANLAHDSIRSTLKDEPDRQLSKDSSGEPPALDFAAILEHIRNREVAV